MKVIFIEPKEILALEREIGFELVARERFRGAASIAGLTRFYVSFEKGEAMEGGCLVGYSGSGDTVDLALKDYCRKISLKRMAFNACSEERKEINFPLLIHTHLLGY